jgi:hypothetical protein|tara:strand:+ start:3667 stop:4089 length:423 start_codon:yes stop_codon:yes gene_type:complete
MLSRRDFNKMAEIVANHPSKDYAIQQAIHDAFYQFIMAFPNPAFQSRRFTKACKIIKSYTYEDEDGIAWEVKFEPSEKIGPVLCKDNQHDFKMSVETDYFGLAGEETLESYPIWECPNCTACRQPLSLTDWDNYFGVKSE